MTLKLVMCFSHEDIKQCDELHRPLNLEDLNLTLWNDKCDYIDPESCTNLNPEDYNLLVLQHNIRGLKLFIKYPTCKKHPSRYNTTV